MSSSNPSFITGLNLPVGLVINNNILYVANALAATIATYDATTGDPLHTDFITNVPLPYGLAIYNGILYVTEFSSNIIATYDAINGGAPLNASFITGLTNPGWLAISNGVLYVSNSLGTTVGKYDATNGDTLDVSFISGLSQPTGLAISNNILYVTVYNNSTTGGGTIGTYHLDTGEPINTSFITGLTTPLGLAISNNNLYVANANDNNIGQYNATTGETINASFITTTLNAPTGLAISNNNLYVTNRAPSGDYSNTIGLYNLPPPPPTNVQASPGNSIVTVTWSPPVNDGGSPIISYTAYANDGYGTIFTGTTYGSPPATTVTITGLTNGTNYEITVTSTNIDGYTSNPSSPPVDVIPGSPTAPTNVVATAGNLQATITWTASNDNGYAIQYYTVTCVENPTITTTTSETTVTITGLIYNTSYSFTVTATNVNGTSSISFPSFPIFLTPCFLETSKILTEQGYKEIKDLRKGDLVKTVNHGLKPIVLIGKRDIVHQATKERIKDQLYQCSPSEYPELFEPLILTGCHSILVDKFVSEEQRQKAIEVNGDIYVTDRKYRLPACVDLRASVYPVPGTYTIYHLALEHSDYYMNYGIYANGLLVETCSQRYLKELSGMELI